MRRTIVLCVDDSGLSDTEEQPSIDALRILVRVVAELESEGCSPVVVFGGLSRFGREVIPGLRGVPPTYRDHVLNTIGRARVTGWFATHLADFGLRLAVVPVSRSALAGRRGHLATRETLRGLAQVSAIPVVWDDSPVLEGAQPRYSYSDQVAALIAGLVGSQSCVLFSKHGGIQVRSGTGVERLREIDGLDLARSIATGQVHVKVPSAARMNSVASAAKIISGLGSSLQIVALTNGLTGRELLSGQAGTLITSRPQARVSAIRSWLSVGAVPNGIIVVSPYAATKLGDADRSSLLGAGVIRVEGEFSRDDVVALEDQDGQLLGYGLVRFNSNEVVEFQGKRDIVVVHADHFFGFQLPAQAPEQEPASAAGPVADADGQRPA